MILTISQITEILKSNPNRSLISYAKDYASKMRMHLYGENLEGELRTIEGWEDQALRKLRVKYAKSNKDLFARLSRPIDRVFSAKGGSVYYSLDKPKEKKAIQLVSDVTADMSAKRWTEKVWRTHYLDDPGGLIFMEIETTDKVEQLRRKNKSYVYPTYVPSSAIFDYLPTGQKLEYVVFTVSEKEKQQAGVNTDWQIYRVVDDAYDYWVRWDGNSAIALPNLTYPNLFGEVPGRLCSDIVHPTDPLKRISFFDEVIDLANEFLLKGSIKITHDFKHGFPKYWEYADDCNVCDGSGMKVGNRGEDCEACGGKGKLPMLRVSDVKILRPPTDKNDPTIAPNVGGYIEPSKTYWEIATADLADLESLATFTKWGHVAKTETNGQKMSNSGDAKTATQVMDEIRPQEDRLYDISAAAEKIDKFIRDSVIAVQIEPGYQDCLVNYGRRYMLENPDSLWEKYCDAKAKKAPVSALNDLYFEYLEAKYQSDPVKLATQIKLMKVEPFFHSTTADVKILMPAEEDLKAKMYFDDWTATLTEEKLLVQDEATLRKDLYAFAAAKKLPAPEPAKPIAA